MINNQNKNKVYLSIIGILLVANIALVSFLLLKKDHDKPEHQRTDRRTMIANFLKTEIGFDTAQLQQYDLLSKQHKEVMKKMFDSSRTSKDKQFKDLAAANFSDTAMDSIAGKSAAAQRTIELKMFNHLKSVRMLCQPDQLPKFDSLFVKMLNRRNNDGRKKKDSTNHKDGNH